LQLEAHPLAVLEREVPSPAGTFVLLHGRGTDEQDLYGLFDVLDPDRRLRGITVGAPFRLPPGGKHWYVVERVGFPQEATFHHSMAALNELLGDLDWSTTLVGGFSQGSVMSFALGLGAGRPVPAGIVAFSGFVPQVDGWEPDLASRPGLPVFLAHGSLDPVISVECPGDIEMEEGNDFQCVARDDRDRTILIDVAQDDAEGNVTWRIRPD
jgi:phospholipase/carboxylesterase